MNRREIMKGAAAVVAAALPAVSVCGWTGDEREGVRQVEFSPARRMTGLNDASLRFHFVTNIVTKLLRGTAHEPTTYRQQGDDGCRAAAPTASATGR